MDGDLARQWRTLLADHGVEPRLGALWASFARPQIELHPGEPDERDAAPVGSTRFGGDADLPRGAAWPTRQAYGWTDGRRETRDHAAEVWPLAFLCQINLEQVAQAGGCGLSLPERGLLSFFYDVDCQPWGFDPADGDGALLLYTPPSTALARQSPPDDLEGGTAVGHAPTLVPRSSLPDPWTLIALCEESHPEQAAGLRDRLRAIPEEVRSRLTADGHALGGWPDVIQGDMRLECQLVWNGINCGGPAGYASRRAQALRGGASDWHLLLQLASDEERLGWMWGDAGRLYWWNRVDAGGAVILDERWTVLQCH